MSRKDVRRSRAASASAHGSGRAARMLRSPARDPSDGPCDTAHVCGAVVASRWRGRGRQARHGAELETDCGATIYRYLED